MFTDGSRQNVHCEIHELGDIRKRSIYIDQARVPAIYDPYGSSTANTKNTAGLAAGTQAKMIESAWVAYDRGFPLNVYLSVRWDSLLAYDDWQPIRLMTVQKRIPYLVELIRKWITYRGAPAHYMWAREATPNAGEHWHMALHVPTDEQKTFLGYLEGHLVEPLMSRPRPKSQKTRGEIACSVWGSWHLAVEENTGSSQFPGYWIAAYTGKGEPSQRLFRGSLRNNARKPVRGKRYGGSQNDDRYDALQGVITGTTARTGRYDIARSLK